MLATWMLAPAAEEGDAECLARAIANGADVNSSGDTIGTTALHMAAQHGHPECVELLVQAGAAVSAATALGMTPLHMAALGTTHAHAECVDALLSGGADPAARSVTMQTPLHCAAQKGAVWALHRLVIAAPDAALAIDRFNRTPLEAALVNTYCGSPGRWTQHATACAFCLLVHAPLHPERLGSVLTYLATKDSWAHPLYALLLRHNPLTPAQWELVPPGLPGLGFALPAVKQRSEAEAAQLLRRMAPADRAHLRTAARSLGAAERRGTLPCLPFDLLRGLLPQCAEQHGKEQLRRLMTTIYDREKAHA